MKNEIKITFVKSPEEGDKVIRHIVLPQMWK